MCIVPSFCYALSDGELIEIVVLIDSGGARESLLLDKHAFMVVLHVAAQPKLQHKFNSNKLP